MENHTELRVVQGRKRGRKEPIFLRVLRNSQPHPLIVMGGFHMRGKALSFSVKIPLTASYFGL